MWIEITRQGETMEMTGTSQPARAVWIEILGAIPIDGMPKVTACEGCVD